MKRTELLAPAGDFSCMIAAFNAGADAVYLAGKHFGARAFANNFEENELLEALDYAHMLSKKIYLTLNTLIKESEFNHIREYLTPFYKNGLDGIIIQDLGLVSLLKNEFPLLEIHASTQMTVNNYRSAKWLKEQGICRVVPSRELSLEELKEIKEKADIEVEAFIHGAMCYGYSGQCLFSSFLGGRSGNRGKCAQPCRLPYKVNNGAKNSQGNTDIYPLSLKDLCSLPYIYELLDAGIDSFKIEGRMKSPEYVAGVTSVYRKYIDSYYDNIREPIDKTDMELLNHLYIRSEMKYGYFKKHNGRDMISLFSPSYQGCDDKLIEKIHDTYCISTIKLPIAGSLSLIPGKPAKITVRYRDLSVTKHGETVQIAQNRPLSKEDVQKQINKTGNSAFIFDTLNIDMDDSIFMPVKKLNELRRDVLDELKKAVLSVYIRPESVIMRTDVYKEVINTPDSSVIHPLLRVLVRSKEQIQAVIDSKSAVDRIYIPSDLFYLQIINLSDDLVKLRKRGIKIYLLLPRIIRKRDDEYLEYIQNIVNNFEGVMIQNLESLYYLQSIEYKREIVTDSMLYNWNQNALQYLNLFRNEFTYPLELSIYENRMLNDFTGEYIIYGRAPMMVSANCIRKTTNTCTLNHNSFSQSLTDRYHKELPVYVNCVHCYNEIYNAVSMSCHKEVPQLLKQNFYKFRLNFTNEDFEITKQILEYYQKILDGVSNKEAFPIKEYTLGHYKEGAL